MGDLQCTLEFSVELHKFINVDLFQRGFYQLRITLKTSPKLPAKVEVSLPKNSSCPLVFPACIVNGTAVSKTFQILYKNEEVILDDLAIFKVHALVEGYKIIECLLKADFQIIVELWFTDQTFGPDQHNSIHCVSTRTLLIHFDPCRGLHHHLPLLFDYFHLCAVTITIHASILALCQPYLRKGVIQTPTQSGLQRTSKQTFLTSSPRIYKKSHSSMDTILFGSQTKTVPHSTRMYRARFVYWELCSVLLSAFNSLTRKMVEYMSLLPPWQQLKLESFESSSHLDNLSDFAKECLEHLKSTPSVPPSKDQIFGLYETMDTEEEMVVKANGDIAQMCGALILAWQQFLEVVIHREKIRQHLSRQRHFQRVKRFSEAFFIIERTRDSALAACDSSADAYQEVTEALRRSSYLNLLPPLEVECVELDGDFSSLPIVYEEHFQETARRGSSNSHSSQSESTVSLCDVNFLVNETIDEKPPRRNSQGSLGQKSRSPDISATPTSPSAISWCPESVVSSPVSVKPSPLATKKQKLKDKLLNNFKVELESDCEEYNLCTGTFSRLNQKITLQSKIRLRSKTVNFLKQLKKPHFNQGPSSVVLLGVKKLDSSQTIACGLSKSSRIPFSVENGIRHSQSTLSVMSTLYTEGKSLSNSESMPDLTSGYIPPPPPPPRSRFASSELEWAALDLSIQNSDKVPSKMSTNFLDRKGNGCKMSNMPTVSPSVRSRDISNKNIKSLSHNHSLDDKICKLSSSANRKAGKQRTKSAEGWRDDDVFIALKVPSEYSNKSEHVVSSQPSKSGQQDIFQHKAKKLHSSKKASMYTSITQSASETTFDIGGETNICEICPPSPPVQFRDPPQSNECKNFLLKNGDVSLKQPNKNKKSPIKNRTKATSWTSDSCLTSLICQGTLFFPKPPAQFAGDDSDEMGQLKNSEIEVEEKQRRNIRKVESSDILEDEKAENTESLSSDLKDDVQDMTFYESKCTILEMLTDLRGMDECYQPGNNICNVDDRSFNMISSNSSLEDVPSVRRASVIGTEMISFVKAKEEFRKQLRYPWLWYSDFPCLASSVPYFQCDSDLRAFSPEGMHLVVCVHGLDGNSADLRLVRTYLELGLPTINFEFLMSERNQGETFDDFDTLTDRLVSEITYYIEVYGLKPAKISFIGHSLGNIIIRSALTRTEMKPYLSKLHTFLSLSGPHLGTLYNNSGLVNMGMWFMQKWKKSGSLLQLAMKDASDPRQTFLYKLSKSKALEYFQNILLFGSSQDRYVPLHSARIEMCKSALKDSSLQGIVYREMVSNLIQPIIQKPEISLLRYDVHHVLPSSANSLIGRAAHIAVLDSELFIEKFLVVCGLRFFT